MANEVEKLQDRISELEKPYVLTDTPPSEPGWYVIFNGKTHLVSSVTEHQIMFNPAWFEVWQFGTAPLPLPRGEDE